MWNIVIVDDDRSVLQGMKRMIPWEEFNARLVGEAMDGSEGLRIIQECSPDIVITDIYMPVMNGLDMIQQLRSTDFAGKIVILSGYSDFEYARQALRLGVDDYLSKPVTLNTLRELLGKLLGQLEQELTKKEEEEEIKVRLQKYEPYVRHERMRTLLIGLYSLQDKSFVEWAEEFQDGQSAHYVTMVMEMVRTDRMVGWTARDYLLLRFAVGNIAAELAAEEGLKIYFAELQHLQMAVLLHVDPGLPRKRAMETCRKLAERIHEAVTTYLRIELQIGLGSVKEEWKTIATGTQEAQIALLDKISNSEQGLPVFQYRPPVAGSEDEGGVRLRSLAWYQKLTEAVRQLDPAYGEAAIAELGDQLEGVSIAGLQRMGSELWTIWGYALYETGMNLNDMYAAGEIEKELKILLRPSQWKDWVLHKLLAICERFGRTDNVKHKKSVDFIVAYVHEHYAEEIRLQELAEKLYISRNYLSNIFRNATGETFNDYVTRVRIEKAKKLILQGNLMVYEIAEAVGYKNVSYFTTLFKKQTGRSPSEFSKGY
ncbi:response regulator transcription factor [Paenibacillus roseipurpureus]|uniref:Response regulator transcription factor n=1 Tax=Paenibacillus roseopurpureus TaxID=2918901 RepID=A0AA96LN09_9BACL|nr:response regulator transcription factor [Paenibacillus sp. MBLB1832]WNR42834.1 response regulator transcription factor [Paenibacillus sp. MBLB1832]